MAQGWGQEYSGSVWKNEVSDQAQEFINQLIEPNLNKRMTCDEALAHPWITSVKLIEHESDNTPQQKIE